jgi:hypothetical protein
MSKKYVTIIDQRFGDDHYFGCISHLYLIWILSPVQGLIQNRLCYAFVFRTRSLVGVYSGDNVSP